ncbi:Bromodomain-containing protein, partial [Phakopsora pachyrhizi]
MTDSEPIIPGYPGSNMSKDQQRFAISVIKQLKRHRLAAPFVSPVDIVALNIPDYLLVIKNPMDLGTIETRLGKGAPCFYRSVEQFAADVQLIFTNCYTYNGSPESSQYSRMALDLSIQFETQMKKMPSDEPGPLASSSRSPSLAKPLPKTTALSTAESISSPAISAKRKLESPADLHSQTYGQDTPTVTVKHIPNTKAELKFCKEVLRELNKKIYEKSVWPFYEPVDIVKLNIPDYPKIIKKPMDLSTMKQKLDGGEYSSAEAFADDFRLMLNNCFAFNPAGHPINSCGRQLESLFEAKWAERPPELIEVPVSQPEPSPPQSEAIEDIEGSNGANSNKARTAAGARRKSTGQVSGAAKRQLQPHEQLIERQNEHRQQINQQKMMAASLDGSSTTVTLQKAKAASVDDYFVKIDYEQKKDLATQIQNAVEPMQSDAINLIRNSRPDLVSADGEEIELDIDALDDRTLYQLYQLV